MEGSMLPDKAGNNGGAESVCINRNSVEIARHVVFVAITAASTTSAALDAGIANRVNARLASSYTKRR
jgi:hypothetical protein